MKYRWFNYRPLCIVFFALLLGSVFAFYVTQNTVISVVIVVLSVIFLAFIAAIRRKLKYFLLPIIAFLVGVFAFNICVTSFNKDNISPPDSISARVAVVSKPEDGSVLVHLDNCKLDGVRANTSLAVLIYDSNNIFANVEIGSLITFKPSKFIKNDLVYNSTPNSNAIAKNERYFATVDVKNLTVTGRDTTFAEDIRAYIKANLSNGLTNENVEIAYSALFGDTEMLSDNQYLNYKLAGVAHLLAVSGLHVGIIVGILNFISKKLKIKPIFNFIFNLAFLLFYMYLCNFSVSVVRASIMSLSILFAFLVKREPDQLSALSLAGIIIYLFNPTIVFNLSFLMSFSSVLGIIMLYKPIISTINKNENNAVAKGFAISLSITISLMFIMAFFFKNLNIIQLFANIIIIPIFTFAFVCIFVLAMCSLILPKLTLLLLVINPVLDFVNVVSIVLGNLPIANFSTIRVNFISILVYFILLLFLGRICTVGHKEKVIISLSLIAILLLILI